MAIGRSFSWFWCQYSQGCFTFCWFVCLFVLALLYILALQNAPGSSIFYPRPRISNFSKETFVYPSSMLPHALAVLFSHMVVIFHFLPLSLYLLPMLLPFLHSCSPILFCMCMHACLCLFSETVIYLNTQSTSEQKNRHERFFPPTTRKMPLGPRPSRVISENS